MATIAERGIAEVGETWIPNAAPSRRSRLLVALAIGAFCGMVVGSSPGVASSDWAQIWHGAQGLIHRVSPYGVVGPGRAFDWDYPLLYPLPAILVAVPFAFLPIAAATGLFIGVSATLLSYLMTRERWMPLILLVSVPFGSVMMSGQWGMLLTSAALLTPLGFLFVAKPTVGAALWLYRPSRAAVIGGTLLVLASLAVQPYWLGQWMAALSSTSHMVVPLAHDGGPLVLLALLRWRRPEARLLLAMACIPQTGFLYCALPLVLVPQTLAETALFVGLSHIAFRWWDHLRPFHDFALSGLASARISILLLYLPCLAMVLHRPNEGELPEWIERAVARIWAKPQSMR